MTIPRKIMLCMTTAMCAAAFAQAPTPNSSANINLSASNKPVAYVYVSRTVNGGTDNEIVGFAAAPNGKLAVIPGSPFQENVKNLAVNGKYLFATTKSGTQIESYRIEEGGALRYATSTKVGQPDNPNNLGPLFLDHTGTTLYGIEFNGNGYGNNLYKSLNVDKPIGSLDVVGNSSSNSWLSNPAAFVGSNVYAYSASCLQNMYWGIFGFKRSSNGLLAEININPNPPTPPDGYFYCPSQAASSPTNHVAISMQPINQSTFAADRAPQLATYIADEQGNLTTASTLENMPESLVVSVKSLSISPSAALLAVGGTGGLQIFHFNAGKPITHYTGLLTKEEVDQFFWDNQNHLYAISSTAGKLFVFTVTPTSYEQAPGSPYTIEKPLSIIVQPE